MSELNNIQQNNEQLLNDIQSLQTIEQQLFNNLETNPNLTTIEKEKIILKINQISNMRINLYQTLSGVNNYFKNALSSSQGTLKEQSQAITIVENELNTVKKQLKILEEKKNNKIRLVEINEYYSEKYDEHGNLMKIIIFTLVPIIILTFLNNKSILPNIIYFILLIIISGIGGYYFWVRFGSIIARDNMNYQAYDWFFDAKSAPAASNVNSTDPWASNMAIGTCVGNACCSDGQTYDETLYKCIGSSNVNISTKNVVKKEGFITENEVNNILIKGSNKYKTDVILNGDDIVKPSISKSFINY